MSAGIARSMVEAGVWLRAWNRTASEAKPLEADGAALCNSPGRRRYTSAGIIVAIFCNRQAIFNMMTAAGRRHAPEQIWWRQTTFSVSWLDELAEHARNRGLIFLERAGTSAPTENPARKASFHRVRKQPGSRRQQRP